MAEIRIVGTAHVSQKSIDDVKDAIQEFKPDIVAVELDQGRFAALRKQMADPSVDQVLEAKNFNQLLVQWVLAYLQRKIGMDVGVEPGAEMRAAIEEAERLQLRIGLIDRDIRVTLRRFWRSLSLFEKIKMFYALAVSLATIDGEQIDVDQMTRSDMVSSALEEFRKFSPNGARALIDERDAYLAHQVLSLSRGDHGTDGGRILAVVGAGHVKGMEEYIAHPETLPPIGDLTRDAPSPPWGMIFGVAVTVTFVFLLLAIAFSGVGIEVLLSAMVYWVIIHGILTALFTLAAGGHPLSALTGFAVSWMTALNPLIAAGWFSAIVEAKIRKPAPSDFKKIFASESFREMWRIPLFRVVLVAALANLGSTLGTIVYFIFIFPALGIDPGVLLTQGFGNMWAAITGIVPS